MRSVIRCVVLTMPLLAVGRGAAAQVTLGLQPVIGYYWPLGYFQRADLVSTALPKQPGDLRGGAWGGDLQFRIHHRFAIEGFAQTTTHTLPSCLCPNGPTDPVPVRVSVAALTGQYDLSLQPTRYHLWASLGQVVIRHSGRGYERPDSPVSWGGAGGLQLAIPFASHFELVGAGTGIGYWFDLDFPPQHGPQLDALLSVGVRWHS